MLHSRRSPGRLDHRPASDVLVVCHELGHGVRNGHHDSVLHRPAGVDPRCGLAVSQSLFEYRQHGRRVVFDYLVDTTCVFWKYHGVGGYIAGGMGILKGSGVPFLVVDLPCELVICISSLFLVPELFLGALSPPVPIVHANRVQMNPKYDQPFNAVYLSTAIAVLLSCVSLGSSLAFSIITSLSLLALMSTYSVSIGCVLLRRITGPDLPHARWSLGRLGGPINLLAVVYSAFIVLMSCFPSESSPGLADANWAPLIWAAVILLSVVAYVFHGREHFTPPVMFIEGQRVDGVGIQKVE